MYTLNLADFDYAADVVAGEGREPCTNAQICVRDLDTVGGVEAEVAKAGNEQCSKSGFWPVIARIRDKDSKFTICSQTSADRDLANIVVGKPVHEGRIPYTKEHRTGHRPDVDRDVLARRDADG